MERFPRNLGMHCNLSNNVAKYELFMCYIYIYRLESTNIFCTNDFICRAILCHLSFLPYQFSIFDAVGGRGEGSGSPETKLSLVMKCPY